MLVTGGGVSLSPVCHRATRVLSSAKTWTPAESNGKPSILTTSYQLWGGRTENPPIQIVSSLPSTISLSESSGDHPTRIRLINHT